MTKSWEIYCPFYAGMGNKICDSKPAISGLIESFCGGYCLDQVLRKGLSAFVSGQASSVFTGMRGGGQFFKTQTIFGQIQDTHPLILLANNLTRIIPLANTLPRIVPQKKVCPFETCNLHRTPTKEHFWGFFCLDSRGSCSGSLLVKGLEDLASCCSPGVGAPKVRTRTQRAATLR